jgi:hypothetical protein
MDADARRAYHRAYYARTRDRRRAMAKANRQRTREHLKAYFAAYREKTREKRRESARTWAKKTYERDKEKRLANAKRWREMNPDRVRELHRIAFEKPITRAISKARARAYRDGLRIAKKMLSPEQWAVVAAIIEEGRALGLWLDHRNPLTPCKTCGVSGGWEPENLQLLAPSVNIAKHNRCQSCWDAISV